MDPFSPATAQHLNARGEDRDLMKRLPSNELEWKNPGRSRIG
jgi:hypothetical protein